MNDLTAHESWIAVDLLSVIDHAGRVLIAASPGSRYQLDKAHGLLDAADQLVKRLEKETLTTDRSAVVAAALEPEARRYTLGRVLADAGSLGGTA